MTWLICFWQKPGYCPRLLLSLICSLYPYPVHHQFWFLSLKYISNLFSLPPLSYPGHCHLSLTAVSTSRSPQGYCGDLSTTQVWSFTSPTLTLQWLPILLWTKLRTLYTHGIPHGLPCLSLSSFISLTLLHSPAHGPVAPSRASGPLSRLFSKSMIPSQAMPDFYSCESLAGCQQVLVKYLWNEYYYFAGIEDAESWHGRPMPTERADAIIKLIESQIETNRHLKPKPPVEDSPPVNITDIQMTSPPAYQVGEKVSKVCFLLFFLNPQNSSLILSLWMNQLLDGVTFKGYEQWRWVYLLFYYLWFFIIWFQT